MYDGFNVRYNPNDNSVRIYSWEEYTGLDIPKDEPAPTAKPQQTFVPLFTPTPEPTTKPLYNPNAKIWLDSPPPVGEQVTEIGISADGVNRVYIANSTTWGEDGSTFDRMADQACLGGDCVWWEMNRWQEVYGEPQYMVTTGSWLGNKNGKPSYNGVYLTEEQINSVYFTWDLTDIKPLSMAHYGTNGSVTGANGKHSVFIEYVERDKDGNPVNIYYTEGGYSLLKAGKPLGVIKKKTWEQFQTCGNGGTLLALLNHR